MEILPYTDPEFKETWNEWIQYRKDKKISYKSKISVEKQLKWFVKNKLTASEAIETLEHSMRCGYAGVFLLKNNSNGVLRKSTTASSFTATEIAFENLQRNIDISMREGNQDT